MEELIFPLQKLVQPILWQAYQVKEDGDGECDGEVAHEFAFALVLERIDEQARPLADLRVQLPHLRGLIDRVQRLAENGVVRGIGRKRGGEGKRGPVRVDSGDG